MPIYISKAIDLIFIYNIFLRMKSMGLNEMRQRLISYGYHPEEVEYTIIEVLQYKRSESLNNIDFNVLSNMLQEKLEIARAENNLEFKLLQN